MGRSGYHSGGKQVQYLSQIGAHPSQPDFNLRCLGPLLLIVSQCVCMCVCRGGRWRVTARGYMFKIKQKKLENGRKAEVWHGGKKDMWKWWKLGKNTVALFQCQVNCLTVYYKGSIWTVMDCWNAPNTWQLFVLYK